MITVFFSFLVLSTIIALKKLNLSEKKFKLLPVIFVFISLLISPSCPNKGLILAGLSFGMLGDYLIIDTKYFIHAMISFAIGHLFYISAYFINFHFSFNSMIIAFVYYVSILTVMKKYITIPVLFKAVCGYTLILTFMALVLSNSHQSYAIVGGILFVISDTCVALNAFVIKNAYISTIGLIIYYFSQYFIALGIMR